MNNWEVIDDRKFRDDDNEKHHFIRIQKDNIVAYADSYSNILGEKVTGIGIYKDNKLFFHAQTNYEKISVEELINYVAVFNLK